MNISIASPSLMSSMTLLRSLTVSIFLWLTSLMISRDRIPASSALLSASTSTTITPWSSFRLYRRAISGVKSATRMPSSSWRSFFCSIEAIFSSSLFAILTLNILTLPSRQTFISAVSPTPVTAIRLVSSRVVSTFWPLTDSMTTSPLVLSWLMIPLARFTGMANPIPCPPATIAVFIPITSPSMFRRGPPLLPGLMDASVWMKSSYGPDPITRPLALTMPAVTVCSKPNGFPMAITHWPTLSSSESRPTISASNSFSSLSITSILSAFSTTWLLVTI